MDLMEAGGAAEKARDKISERRMRILFSCWSFPEHREKDQSSFFSGGRIVRLFPSRGIKG